METKRSNSGRKKVPDMEKKRPVTIWVKGKYVGKAKTECLKIQTKYENL